MNDLSERLRAHSRHHDDVDVRKDAKDAADELERFRVEVRALESKRKALWYRLVASLQQDGCTIKKGLIV